MSTLTFNDRTLTLKPFESVLDCLLRHGEALPYACKAGMCQACIIRTVNCAATEESTQWIKPALRAKGYTLACKWIPEGDVAAAKPILADFALAARVQQLTLLNADVMQVLLTLEEPGRLVSFRPGQYLTATNEFGCARAYSVANDYQVENYFELHVARTSHGEWSNWLFQQAKMGDRLFINGPHGACYYDAKEDADSPLLLAGTGTGLAPLYGIARDALTQGHQAPLSLYHGGRTPEQLYLITALQQLAVQYPNFSYFPCTKEPVGESINGGINPRLGSLEQLVLADQAKANLRNCRIFLSGAPAVVHTLRKRLYLQGARPEHIHCDPFTERTILNVLN